MNRIMRYLLAVAAVALAGCGIDIPEIEHPPICFPCSTVGQTECVDGWTMVCGKFEGCGGAVWGGKHDYCGQVDAGTKERP